MTTEPAIDHKSDNTLAERDSSASTARHSASRAGLNPKNNIAEKYPAPAIGANGKPRGLAHDIRAVRDQLPETFEPAVIQQLLKANGEHVELQRVKWAVKWLVDAGEVFVFTHGTPGRFGSRTIYTCDPTKAAAPKWKDKPAMEGEPWPEVADESECHVRGVDPARLPHMQVEPPRPYRSARHRDEHGNAAFNPNVPRLDIIERKLNALGTDLLNATEQRRIEELQSELGEWERKRALAQMGEGQGT